MPTKTGEKVRIIVLGTGPDADTARAIAESDADVALAKQFTKTVTHLVADDTVKPTEARLKKAEEAGVPVLTVAEFRALLVAGAEDEEETEAVETPAAETEEAPAAEVEEAPAAGGTADVAEAETAAATADVEPEPVAEAPEPEPVTAPAAEPVEELEPVDESEKPSEAAPTETAAATTSSTEPEPVAEAIDEPEEAKADPEQAVPAQTKAPAIETTDAGSEKAKPGLLAKIKSIFGLTGARK
ncbi:hypothetical protein [Glycomyces albidus]|uniref:hypothetical protein n=1 Tax=Glycomyces albidus TaxID=2656774 RepID=UPI00128FE6E3|nr:hypothetical protein [Glycomyces albidus]